jgi:hypothetical protein
MRDMRIANDEMLPGMKLLRPASEAGRRTMRALGAFAREASPMARHLRPFSNGSSRLTPGLEAFLRQVNPFAAYMAPYFTEQGALFANMKAITRLYDATGHYGRVLGMQSKSNAIGAFTPDQQKAYDALVKSGALKPFDSRGINPYAKPGGADKLVPFTGRYPQLRQEGPYH